MKRKAEEVENRIGEEEARASTLYQKIQKLQKQETEEKQAFTAKKADWQNTIRQAMETVSILDGYFHCNCTMCKVQ